MSRAHRTRNLNHARVNTYRVTMNERFDHHFLISPSLIFENEIMFVYNDNGTEIQKSIPTKDIIRHCTVMKFFGRDPETLHAKYNGYAYEVSADVIKNYK